MRYLLDTNTCIYLLNGRHPELATRLARISASAVSISSIVWFELMFGAAKSARRSEAEERLCVFARQIDVLDFDIAAAEAAAAIRAKLERSGRSIGAFDTLIAGHAVARKDTLVTHNLREFTRVPGLRTVDWLAG